MLGESTPYWPNSRQGLKPRCLGVHWGGTWQAWREGTGHLGPAHPGHDPASAHCMEATHSSKEAGFFFYYFLILFCNFKNIFNYSLQSILLCISFRCTAQRSDSPTLHEVTPLILLVPTWSVQSYCISSTLLPLLYSPSLRLFGNHQSVLLSPFTREAGFLCEISWGFFDWFNFF